MARVIERNTFYEVLSAAINDLMEHGFDSQARLDRWMRALAQAAGTSLISEEVLKRTLRDTLHRTFKRSTSMSALMKVHPGVGQFTLEQIKPHLRAELDRRILASASLIRLNRDASIAKTLQRFAGWATSIPAGGTEIESRQEVKKEIRRGIAGLSYEERRVTIDQSHKLVAAINEIVATDGGAIAGTWRHVKRGPPSYDSRPEHVAREGHVFLIRDSWAHQKGFVKPKYGYTDEIEAPAQLLYCSCSWEFKFALRDLPPDMLTARGKAALLEARKLTA